MTALTIRRAAPADADAVLALVSEASTWLAERGSDQWQYPTEALAHGIGRDIGRSEVWAVEDPTGTVVATITLNERADAEFWTESDNPSDALYVHRMAVARTHSGHELGSALLDWAAKQATQQHKHWLRLDAWARNSALHAYYLHHSFRAVRTLLFNHRGSGALFERPATVQLHLGPELHEAPNVTSQHADHHKDRHSRAGYSARF